MGHYRKRIAVGGCGFVAAAVLAFVGVDLYRGLRGPRRRRPCPKCKSHCPT